MKALMRALLALLKNEVDGEGFLLLTDEDIGEMVKPLAIKRKLINQRQYLLSLNNEQAKDLIEIEEEMDDYSVEKDVDTLKFSDHDQYADNDDSSGEDEELEFELSQRPSYSPQRSNPVVPHHHHHYHHHDSWSWHHIP